MHARTEAKLPAVTLGFWVIKILATTMGETGGDAVSMSMGLGYLTSTVVFLAIFVAAVAVQIATRRFNPAIYWLAVIASTTVGTTLADFADRSLGIGYPGGATLLLCLTLSSLFAWHRALGSIDIATVVDPRSEAWYWVTIMFSQTLVRHWATGPPTPPGSGMAVPPWCLRGCWHSASWLSPSRASPARRCSGPHSY